MNWYVYIVKCKDNSLLVYTEMSINQVIAAKREREIKGWTRIKKINLIESVKDISQNIKGSP